MVKMAHVGESSGALRDFSPWRSPRRENLVGTSDVARRATAEPGLLELEEIPNTTADQTEVDEEVI